VFLLPYSSYSMLLYFLALVPAALACGAGTGPITATPTMSFTYSPPLSWTWNPPATASGGQSLSSMAAQNRINQDIEYAVLKAVESYGYSTSGVSVRNAVQPAELVILPKYSDAATACIATPVNYIPEDTAVTKKCIDATRTTVASYNVTGSITVSSPVALAESNWDNIATKVWASLTNDAGVKFYGLITVRA
ncbi:hypothetical protein PENTCL1PPCAC_10967, partial [Pristionchus entomophagus]